LSTKYPNVGFSSLIVCPQVVKLVVNIISINNLIFVFCVFQKMHANGLGLGAAAGF